MTTATQILPDSKRFDSTDVCLYDSPPSDRTESYMASESIDSRFQSLHDRLTTIATKVATIEGKLSVPEKKLNPILITVLTFFGTCALVYWGWVGAEIFKMNRDVGILMSTTIPDTLRGASADPTDPLSIALVNRALETARENQIAIPPETIKQVGIRFLEAAKSNKASWSAALKLFDYRSTLNTLSAPPLPRTACFPVPLNADGIVTTISGFTVVNCTQELDHVRWTNVDFRDVTVVYHGGPTVLAGVQFVNCEFTLDYAPPSQILGQSLLASNRLTVTLPTP